MIEWWSTLSIAMKVLWAVTLSASLIFVIQTILTFIGADSGDSDFDMPDMDAGGIGDGTMDMGGHADTSFGGHSGMNLYTFRNFINFLLGFGWTAILLKGKISSNLLLIVVAGIVGVALVAVVMYLFKWLAGMQQSGNINVYTSAVGCIGKVYLTIPAERAGTGKVQIAISNAVREYDAMTDEEEPLKTGDSIKVTEVLGPSTLLVERQNSLII